MNRFDVNESFMKIRWNIFSMDAEPLFLCFITGQKKDRSFKMNRCLKFDANYKKLFLNLYCTFDAVFQ